jgi:Domain of unknown function (DUF5130)
VIAGELASSESNRNSSHSPSADSPPDDSPYGADPLSANPTWHPEVLDGPLSTRALQRVDEALRLADASTGLTFSVYIGDLSQSSRETAELMHGRLVDPDVSVLIAISPNQRVLEIVTGSRARRRVLDRDAKLAALSMSAAFAGGDLGGGIVAGLAQLADHAGRS